MKRLRILLWALVALALAGAGILLLSKPSVPTATSTSTQASIGGPFTLTASDGRPFPSSRLNGKPYAIFFGFTRCPDTCPTTLARLTRLRRELPGGDGALAIVFVSVDPERDTPADVGRYSELFAAPVIGLTGSRQAIERVKRQFGVFSQKVPGERGDYSVDHTATVFLMDGAGKFQATISPGEGDSAALAKLRRLAG